MIYNVRKIMFVLYIRTPLLDQNLKKRNFTLKNYKNEYVGRYLKKKKFILYTAYTT